MQNNDPDDSASGGEFTRLFRSQQPAAAKPPAVAPNTPDSAPVPEQTAATRPMTRIFTAKAQPQRPEHASNPPAFEPKPGPGEFTRMFSVPSQAPPAPVRPAASPAAKETSFTEVFNIPQFPAVENRVDWKEVEGRPAPPPAKREAGEFTQMFERKLPAQAPPPETVSKAGFSKPETPPMKAGLTSFDAPVLADDFAKVIAGPRSRAEVDAPIAQSPTSAVPSASARKAPLWTFVALIAVVLILAAAAMYFFVLRG